MVEISGPPVTILIPNYRTLDLTKLCLRLLRKHTPPEQARVLVIDNASGDASLEYLRGLCWIELLERDTSGDESPAQSHARALDEGLRRVRTPFVLSMHTDTMVKTRDWLGFLLAGLEARSRAAGIGSWKLESKSAIRRSMKRIERVWERFRGAGERRDGPPGGRYLRSHCALYRRSLIEKHNLAFARGNLPAGQWMHQRLVEEGYEMLFLPVEALSRHIVHFNHATMVLHPELGARKRSIARGRRAIRRGWKALDADRILLDTSLDS